MWIDVNLVRKAHGVKITFCIPFLHLALLLRSASTGKSKVSDAVSYIFPKQCVSPEFNLGMYGWIEVLPFFIIWNY